MCAVFDCQEWAIYGCQQQRAYRGHMVPRCAAGPMKAPPLVGACSGSMAAGVPRAHRAAAIRSPRVDSAFRQFRPRTHRSRAIERPDPRRRSDSGSKCGIRHAGAVERPTGAWGHPRRRSVPSGAGGVRGVRGMRCPRVIHLPEGIAVACFASARPRCFSTNPG